MQFLTWVGILLGAACIAYLAGFLAGFISELSALKLSSSYSN